MSYKKKPSPTTSKHFKSFGLPLILNKGMTESEYIALRNTWYDKAQKSGHCEIERYNVHNQALTSSFFYKSQAASLANPANYAASAITDLLSDYYNHIEYLKLNKHIQVSYKISRFFGPDYKSHMYFLETLLLGIPFRESVNYIAGLESKCHEHNIIRLNQLSNLKHLKSIHKNKTHNQLWYMYRLVHECAWQFLVHSGLQKLEYLTQFDLLGLDSPYIQKHFKDSTGFNGPYKSTITRATATIY